MKKSESKTYRKPRFEFDDMLMFGWVADKVAPLAQVGGGWLGEGGQCQSEDVSPQHQGLLGISSPR